MERLTKRDGSGRAHMVKYATDEVIERLAAYEDSGMNPVQCANMAAVSGILQTLDNGGEYIAAEWKAAAPFNSVLKKVEDEDLRDEIDEAVGGYMCEVKEAAMWYGMRCMKEVFRPLEP